MGKQKPLDKKKLLKNYGDTVVDEKEFKEAVTRMAQTKPKKRKKDKN